MVKCLGYKLNYFYMCSLGNIKKVLFICVFIIVLVKELIFYKVFGYKLKNWLKFNIEKIFLNYFI